ncbi:MAG: glycosyltransferase family 9 protein [Flavobacterium sp.]
MRKDTTLELKIHEYMITLKKINIYRRKITKYLTSNIGESTAIEGTIDLIVKEHIKRILIIRPNHRLGNIILITPIVQEVNRVFPNATIDLFVKGNIANVVFKNYNEVDEIISLPKQHFKQLGSYLLCWLRLKSKEYDLVVNCVEHSSSGKLLTRFSRARHKFYGATFLDELCELHFAEQKHIAKNAVYSFRNFSTRKGLFIDNTEIPKLDLKLSQNELQEGEDLIYKLTKNRKETIVIYTYATGDKCYSRTWWNVFYELLTNNFPDFNIIEILPIEGVSNINYMAPSFYSENLRQIGALIANSKMFIGADSGMMHLASASLTRTVGLFCITDDEKYKPYGNGSFAIDTRKFDLNDCIDIIKKSISN